MIFKAGEHLHRHIFFHRNLDRARLQHLGADGGQLQHFLIGYFLHFARLGHDAGICGVDAIDIGIDIAALGGKSPGQSDSSSIRPAASQSGDVVCISNALKARDNSYFSTLQT